MPDSLHARPPVARRTPSMAALLRHPSQASLKSYTSGLLSPRTSVYEPAEVELDGSGGHHYDDAAAGNEGPGYFPTASSSRDQGAARQQSPEYGQPEDAEKLNALDEMLQSVGFGVYQRKLLVLAGLGWAADNMWLQAIAASLPRIRDEFDIDEQWIGVLPSSLFTGMMIGASAWGSYSDAYGRKAAFNGTLGLASVFGCLLGFAKSFSMICILVLFLGVGIGGSMPTDGTLFLENTPKKLHYLLTGLSVFFSVGSVVSAGLALIIFPGRTCLGVEECNVEVQNTGWRYLLQTCGVLTFIMFIARITIMRLRESPSWLMSVGQKNEAARVLEHIASINGLSYEAGDLEDGAADSPGAPNSQYPPPSTSVRERDDVPSDLTLKPQIHIDSNLGSALRHRFSLLLTDPMRSTTLLTWAVWTLVSAAYTLFNAFLPSWLERKEAASHDTSQVEELQDFLFFTLAGIPGAVLGAVLVELPQLGQRRSMALSTMLTVLGVLAFTQVSSRASVILSIVVVNLAATLAYAIIYSYTLGVFPAAERGTACGVASALSRLAGILAPLISGILLSISDNMPLYASVLLFTIASGCMFAVSTFLSLAPSSMSDLGDQKLPYERSPI